MKYIKTNIIDIISSTIDKMRIGGNILSITDNLNNTYTVFVSRLGLIKNNWVISISNTPNFNGEYVVKYLDSTLKLFTVQKTSGAVITTLGTFESETPVFYFEKWAGAEREIAEQAADYVGDMKKFPCVLLLLDVKGSFSEGFATYPRVTIFFFEQTEADKNSLWRHQNTMPKLRLLYQNFITLLSQNGNLESQFDHEVTELFYLGTADKNQNKIKSLVDAIQIDISNIKFINEITNC